MGGCLFLVSQCNASILTSLRLRQPHITTHPNSCIWKPAPVVCDENGLGGKDDDNDSGAAQWLGK